MNNGGRWPWLAGLLLVLLVGASCGNGDSESDDRAEVAEPVTTVSETTSPATSETAPAPETTQAAAETTTAPSPTEAEPDTTTTAAPEPLGPPAPDFSLQLSDGETFVLSEHDQPVVVFFWAEW